MDRFAEISARMRARKEAEACSTHKSRLERIGGYWKGKTASGKTAVFEPIAYGMTEVSQTAGTLTIEGKVIFTRGYMSTALKEMDRR